MLEDLLAGKPVRLVPTRATLAKSFNKNQKNLSSINSLRVTSLFDATNQLIKQKRGSVTKLPTITNANLNVGNDGSQNNNNNNNALSTDTFTHTNTVDAVISQKPDVSES